MDEISITRDYRTVFRKAQKNNNPIRMAEVFSLLCGEI